MAKVLRIIAKIASVVAVVAMVLGNPLVAAIATVVATVATIGAQILSKPPPARGSPTQVLIDVEPPRPYVMGEGLIGGVLRYDRAYGYADDVPNPYRWLVFVYSGVTAATITPYTDFEPVSSWYSTFLYTDTQLGACPESSALAPNFSGAPNWGSTAKLSGCAAIGWNLKFDKKGKRFASGMPQLQAYGQWSKAYDPRLDSTRAGGSGTHRVDDEATWAWTENPALHAGTYAYGRYQNGVKVMGIGMPDDGIDWTAVAAWANDCDANDWTIFGRVFEPGDRWANLKEICAAGGGRPVFSGGAISFDWNRPRVALATITEADLGEGRYSKTAGRGYSERFNAIIPKYTDPASNWQQMAAGEVAVSTYVTADGEKRRQEWPFNLVKDVDQAAQLARYVIEDSREQQPITLPLLPQWRHARPGEAYELNIPSLGFTDQIAVVTDRQVNPQTFEVTLSFRTENDAKHAAALAMTGVAPAAVGTVQTSQERDEVAGSVQVVSELVTQLISTSYVTDSDPSDGLLQATGSAITVETHTRTYTDRTVSVTGDTLTTEDDGTTAIAASTTYHVYYDDAGRLGGAVSLKATKVPADAATGPDNPARHYVGSILTDVASGGTGTSAGGAGPPSWKLDNWYV